MKKIIIPYKINYRVLTIICMGAISLALFIGFLTKVFRVKDVEIDFRCLSWATTHVGSGWTKDPKDTDFFMDYYIPPDKKAIICTTPVLASAQIADRDKPFLYEVYPTEYGFRIRIIIGLTEVREPCKNLTGNVNCADYILSHQAIVRYEP